jgi:hypothetical protein
MILVPKDPRPYWNVKLKLLELAVPNDPRRLSPSDAKVEVAVKDNIHSHIFIFKFNLHQNLTHIHCLKMIMKDYTQLAYTHMWFLFTSISIINN